MSPFESASQNSDCSNGMVHNLTIAPRFRVAGTFDLAPLVAVGDRPHNLRKKFGVHFHHPHSSILRLVLRSYAEGFRFEQDRVNDQRGSDWGQTPCWRFRLGTDPLLEGCRKSASRLGTDPVGVLDCWTPLVAGPLPFFTRKSGIFDLSPIGSACPHLNRHPKTQIAQMGWLHNLTIAPRFRVAGTFDLAPLVAVGDRPHNLRKKFGVHFHDSHSSILRLVLRSYAEGFG